MKNIDKTKAILALTQVRRVGDKKIINYIREKDGQLSCQYNDVINTKTVKEIANLDENEWLSFLNYAQDEIDKANQNGISIVSYLDENYPKNLLALDKAPVILYVKGNEELLNTDKSVAIIGTREPTDFGKKLDLHYAKKLSLDGYTIVSGLAIGCDTYAHMGALQGSGKTIAILAHGLDQPVYPKQNRKLAEQILEEDGALVSTYPVGTKLNPHYLAARDEWQSGMSDGVLVIETGIKGGTRIAMRHSVVQHRPLAVADYRQIKHLGDNAVKISQFQGNMDAIQHQNAVPVFTKEELEDFEKTLQKTREERISKLVTFNGENDPSQMDLGI